MLINVRAVGTKNKRYRATLVNVNGKSLPTSRKYMAEGADRQTAFYKLAIKTGDFTGLKVMIQI